MALIMKLVDVKTAAVYFISQCIGGALGYGLLKVSAGGVGNQSGTGAWRVRHQPGGHRARAMD